MNQQTILAMLLLAVVGSTAACAAVIPPTSPRTNNCTATCPDREQWRLRMTNISSSLRTIEMLTSSVNNSVDSVYDGTLNALNGIYQHDSQMSDGERIARSVHIFKCFVPVISEIVSDEMRRKLCEYRTGNDQFFDEFHEISGEMSVALNIRELVLSYRSLNNCILPDNGAPCLMNTFNSTAATPEQQRVETLKSVAENFYLFVHHLRLSVEAAKINTCQ